MPDDEQPDPLSGYVRLGVLDMPTVLAALVRAEAEAAGVPWQEVVNAIVSRWELDRQKKRRRRQARTT